MNTPTLDDETSIEEVQIPLWSMNTYTEDDGT